MEIINLIITSTASIIVLFFLTKIMGRRQISQLSLFDYVNGITIGSIAAEMATSPENFKSPLIAMIVYGVISTLISIGSCKSIILRRFSTGKAMVLYEKGKIYEKNLFKGKLDIDEFLTQCRSSGFFDLSQIHTAFLETNGKISFLPVANQRPVTPQDLNLSPEQETPVSNVVLDGKVMEKNLKFTGNNKMWLESQLRANGVKDIKEVFLATCNYQNKITVYTKTNINMNRDLFS